MAIWMQFFREEDDDELLAGIGPFVHCDLCGKEIEGDSGNVYWWQPVQGSDDMWHVDLIWFTHKECSRLFEARKRIEFKLSGYDDGMWMWEELRTWVRHLFNRVRGTKLHD